MEFPDDAHALLTDWSRVEAHGPDAGKFLQAFCTNDVLKLADGQACEAMFTDVKAHVLAYGWVGRAAEDRYTVLLGSDRADQLAAHLDRYLIREHVVLATHAIPTIVVASDAGGVPLTCFGAAVGAQWTGDAPSEGGRRLSPAEFELLRIQRRVPIDGVDVDTRNLPQEVDRNALAISFTKGCYLGQEPVARIDALGRVNWLLRTLRIEGPPPERGAELLADGKPVARITSAVAAQDGALALAYVRRESAAPGTPLAMDGQAATVEPIDGGGAC